MHAVRRSVVLPLFLVAGLAVAGCGGGDSDDENAEDPATKNLPAVKQDAVQSAPDVATANARCAAYQKKKPERVTQIRFRIKGSPSVPCIIQ